MMAVACTQYEKLKAAILDIGQQRITLQHAQEEECNVATASCKLQAMLNSCIRHHQDIIV